MSRGFKGNGETVAVTTYTGTDGYADAIARGLSLFWNTLSPASRGPSGTRTGLAGYGVNGNRASGYTPPMQNFHSAVRPVLDPQSLRLGIGAGVGGQPGLPSTNPVDVTIPGWLQIMAAGQTAGRWGMVG